MVMVNMIAHVVDVKGAFLQGEFEDGKKVHMKIPQGFEVHFPAESVILMLMCLHGLKKNCERILETADTSCKSVGTITKQCRSLSLRQMS